VNYVGMDVHVRNSYLCVTDAAGQVLKRGRVGNTLAELGRFLGDFEPERAPLRVVMESTTNSRAVHRLLGGYAAGAGVDLRAEVLDARKVRVIAESVSKCDKLDAAVLCELARSNLKLPVCYLPDDEVFALREHLRARADLVRVRTSLKNRVHAVLHRRGVLRPANVADLFAGAGRAWLELEVAALDEAGRVIVERYLGLVDELDRVVAESDASLRELARRDRWARPAALLRTIPGVGLVTALTVLAELGDVTRFRSRAAVSNYSGLVPVVRDSNAKRFRGGITRRGPSHLRGALVEAAWRAVPQVPQYRVIFDRIAAAKGKQVAIVAVARRMLEDGWTMLKRNEVFKTNEVFKPNEVFERNEAFRSVPADAAGAPPARGRAGPAADPSAAG
jgi:transposase